MVDDAVLEYIYVYKKNTNLIDTKISINYLWE